MGLERRGEEGNRPWLKARQTSNWGPPGLACPEDPGPESLNLISGVSLGRWALPGPFVVFMCISESLGAYAERSIPSPSRCTCTPHTPWHGTSHLCLPALVWTPKDRPDPVELQRLLCKPAPLMSGRETAAPWAPDCVVSVITGKTIMKNHMKNQLLMWREKPSARQGSATALCFHELR